MRLWCTAAGVLVLIATLSPSLAAQWPKYQLPGAPKTADGKTDLTAATPRLANGKPDLSGVWVNVRNAAAGRGQPAAPPPPPASGPPVATFRDAAAGIPGGAPMTPWAADLLKARRAENQKDNPDALCLPMGFMQFHTHGQPRKMIHTTGLLAIIYEANYGLRQVFTDGRLLPANEPQPWWYGYSTGQWEGDTLIVETTGLRDGGWLDIWGTPFTDKAKITERFRRPTYGTLEIDVTIDDPKVYTKPWTVRVNQRLTPDDELIEFICHENDKFTPFLSGAFKPGASK